MKIWLLSAAAVALGVGLGWGVTWAEFSLATAPVAEDIPDAAGNDSGGGGTGGRPIASTLEETFEFGKMEIGETRSKEFVIINDGTAPLKLGKPETTCQCALGDLEDGAVPPGGQVKVKLTWKAQGQPREFRHGAKIPTNDPNHNPVYFMVHGVLVQSVIIEPAMLNLGTILSTETRQSTVRVLGFGAEPLKLTGHTLLDPTTADYFHVTYEPMTPDQLTSAAAKSGYQVKVQVIPGLPVTAFRQRIVFDTNVSSAPRIVVPVEGMVAGDIEVTGRGWSVRHGAVRIGTVPSTEGATWTLNLLIRGEKRKETVFMIATVEPDFLQVQLGAPIEVNQSVTRVPVTIAIPKGTSVCDYMGSEVRPAGRAVLKASGGSDQQVLIKVRFLVE